MLNAKALTELLNKNSDERLCKRWFLMTPNGTLLAYSHSTNIRDLRRQAATAALSWQEHQATEYADSAMADGETSKVSLPSMLRTLTIETDSANMMIRKVQPELLLVLEGGVAPRRKAFQPRVTPEGPGDSPYATSSGPATNSTVVSSASSIADSTRSSASQGVLGLQRKKLDALSSAIAQSFEHTGFKMPDETTTKIF